MQPTRLIVLAAAALVAGAAPAQSGTGENLTVYAGFAVYPDPAYDTVALVQVPFSLAQNEFEFFRPTEVDSFLYARIFAQIDLLGNAGVAVDSASTYFSVRVSDSREAHETGIRIFNKLLLFARPGVYSARLTVIDAVSKRSGSAFLDRIVVEPPRRDAVALGGPYLAYSAAPFTDSSAVNLRLVENGLAVPNPLGVFGTGDSTMYCVGEVYQPGKEVGHAGPSTRLTFELLDSRDSLLRVLGARPALPGGATIAFTERFDIGGWLPGVYRLRVVADDSAAARADTQVVRFAVVSPADLLVMRDQSIPGDPYRLLTTDQRTALTWYFLSPEQQRVLERLTPEGKETFLAQYWAEHDRDPATPLNEGRVDAVARFHYVNERFSLTEARDDGWRTDRGRVYLVYGAPDEVDDRVVPLTDQPGIGADNSGRPYQIWYYRGVGEGKLFVFVDARSNNEYRLVHSNVYGEVYNKYWESLLQQGFPDLDRDL